MNPMTSHKNCVPLSTFLRAMVKKGALSERVAKTLNRLPNAQMQSAAIDRIRGSLERFSEAVVQDVLNPTPEPTPPSRNDEFWGKAMFLLICIIFLRGAWIVGQESWQGTTEMYHVFRMLWQRIMM